MPTGSALRRVTVRRSLVQMSDKLSGLRRSFRKPSGLRGRRRGLQGPLLHQHSVLQERARSAAQVPRALWLVSEFSSVICRSVLCIFTLHIRVGRKPLFLVVELLLYIFSCLLRGNKFLLNVCLSFT